MVPKMNPISWRNLIWSRFASITSDGGDNASLADDEGEADDVVVGGDMLLLIQVCKQVVVVHLLANLDHHQRPLPHIYIQCYVHIYVMSFIWHHGRHRGCAQL
eukprot:GHVS01035335.1.p1 GENE.GHVS01035335.1~~GHVS01035335.1.p1  ORF type:complete len:103 (+),score=10.04 GHVS01035335.1:334-642(+)